MKIPKGVTVEWEVEPDDTPIVGNVLASGDLEEDRTAEEEVAEQLAQGNVWAWAVITVRARLVEWEGADTVGGCSYASEADFRADEIYSDMTGRAIDRLRQSLFNAAVRGDMGAREQLRASFGVEAPFRWTWQIDVDVDRVKAGSIPALSEVLCRAGAGVTGCVFSEPDPDVLAALRGKKAARELRVGDKLSLPRDRTGTLYVVESVAGPTLTLRLLGGTERQRWRPRPATMVRVL